MALSQQLQSLQLDKSTVLKYSTKEQLQYPKDVKRLFCHIISIDHLSQDFQDLPVDDILAIGDQALLYQVDCTVGGISKELLSKPPNVVETLPVLDPITEPDVFGPLIVHLYTTLYQLKHRSTPKTRGPCEVLLYLSGHGMDPGNICLVPDGTKAHPAREDLRDKEPANWYKYAYDHYANEVEQYLDNFYEACAIVIGASRKPMGFVGGEVLAHQRGYIGVLGVLGLWCHAHSSSGVESNVFHHLVIVADCCFAGIWCETLNSIMKSEAECLGYYRKLLRDYPVSIQCATFDCEASQGGLFTPLWYFLNTASQEELDYYCSGHAFDEHVATTQIQTQHPWYVSTSPWHPSWKCFDNTALFVSLHGKQLQELERDLSKDCNRMALVDVCTPQEPETLKFDTKRFRNFSPLVRPRVTALASVAMCLRGILPKEQNKITIHTSSIQKWERNTRVGVVESEQFSQLIASSKKSIQTIRQTISGVEQSLASLVNILFEAAQRSQRGLQHYVLGKDDTLTKANEEKLRQLLPVRDVAKDIPPGVYVFQGGEGDMSLIVTPRQEEVILIDGTKTATCFKAAWNSTLRYLQRITHIVVTHHDEDHTFGIQLLLARYCVERTHLQLPDYVEGTGSFPNLSRAIVYMNTRADFLSCKNFRHEKEIATLAKRLKIAVKPVIIDGSPQQLLNRRRFFFIPLLPTWSLLEKEGIKKYVPVEGKVPDDRTKPVYSRGRTTAANVLSINLVAVWKNRDAYLFTGDAHLKDVTEAAQDFCRHYPQIKRFKYVDVPHHGSAHSNVEDVAGAHRGLAGIPADHYLISHCGNHQNPSFQTVFDILQSRECKKLHFLYPRRKHPHSCADCKDNIATWHFECQCYREQGQGKIDTALDDEGLFKFFAFQ